MEMERKMWDAYAKQAGGVTFDGKPLPTWEELGEDRQACWRAAAGVCTDEIDRLRTALREIEEAINAWLPRDSVIKRTIVRRITDALKEGE
jgi:hypothetical protein